MVVVGDGLRSGAEVTGAEFDSSWTLVDVEVTTITVDSLCDTTASTAYNITVYM